MKIFKSILAIIGILILCLIFIDVVKFPEWYISTWRYQLKNDIKSGDLQAVMLYKNVYVDNNRDLFNDNFETIKNIQK